MIERIIPPHKEGSLVTIFMPVYNGEYFLKKSIESIVNQTYTNWELLCVDDSSTDGSLEILEDYASKDDRIKVFSKPNGGNVPKSFNFVKPYMKGDFYMYLSQDDYMSEDNIEKCWQSIACSDAEIAMPACKLLYSNGASQNIELHEKTISGEEAFYLSLNWGVHGFCLYPMSLLNDVVLDENIFNADEYLTRLLFLKATK